MAAVARDDVAFARKIAANHIARGLVYLDAVVRVPQRGHAVHVGADMIAQHRIGRGHFGQNRLDNDAAHAIGRDHVARARGRAADGVARRLASDIDAVAAVAQRRASRLVRADVVSFDGIVRHRAAGQVDSVAGVPRDNVAFAGPRPADAIQAGPACRDLRSVDAEFNARAIGHCRGAAKIGADIIALDRRRRRAVKNRDAFVGIAGNNIALARIRSANGVARRGIADDEDSNAAVVGHGGLAGRVGTDKVACDEIVVRAEKDDAVA